MSGNFKTSRGTFAVRLSAILLCFTVNSADADDIQQTAGQDAPQRPPRVISAPANAQPAQEAGTETAFPEYNQSVPEAPDLSGALGKLAFGTTIVLILAIIFVVGCRKWIAKMQPTPVPGAKQLRVIDTVSLGPRCKVHLLEAGNGRVLAGVDTTGLQTLITLPESFHAVLDEELERAIESGADTKELEQRIQSHT